MPKIKKVSQTKDSQSIRPALSPEARENQLISMAYDLAEERLRDKTASNDLVKEFIRAGNLKSRLELEKMKYETDLVKAKTEAIESASSAEKLFEEAIQAFQSYSGNTPQEAEE
ncbi:MAG: hypothetical protein IJ880_15960 [Bacilli bacterium]|nr:hypothetical protein [Bacilli bacterium]